MTPERRRQVEDLFDRSLDQSPDRRAAFLDAACAGDAGLRAEVQSLLEAHARPDGPLDHPVAPLAASLLDEQRSERRIGPYRVLHELGRGGMGVVYLADRADGQFRRRVAIKLVRSGVDDGLIARRFLAERQILASLNHPHIAQLLDGGVTDGQVPYLVMEYVEGLPITTYAAKHNLGIPARLDLFRQVCAAVHHAHQNLVIHRDLKPSNIIVTQGGEVKLLDFGIAKLLNPSLSPADAPFTRVEQWVMTPDYASPEQVRGEPLTTASDVYALGVILYELIAGHPPYQLQTRSPEELRSLICDRDPERPSVRAASASATGGLAADLRGDLDAIAMMALRKEPGRRYGSAEMLSDDIRRHIDGLPVNARYGNRRYRALKFLQRHRVEMTAAGVVVGSLFVGTGVAVRQAAVAVTERERAEAAQLQAEEVTNFLMELFQSGEAEPGRTAGDVTARDLLQRGAARADALSDQPAVQARMLDAIGRMHHSVGDYDEGERLLSRAVALRRAVGEPEALAESLIHLSWVHRSRSELDAARRLIEEALALRRAALPPTHADVADAVYELGFVAPNNAELEARYREALGILQATGAMPDRQVRLLQGLATTLRRQGRLADALASDREALALAERTFGLDDYRTGSAMVHLADQVRDIEQNLDAAERLYRRGLERLTRELGKSHLQLIHPLHSLAALESRRGNPAEAERLQREALRIRIGAVGERHPAVGLSLASLSVVIDEQRRSAEAEAMARQALELLRSTLGPRHPESASILPVLAGIVARAGRMSEADALYREAIDLKAGTTEAGRIDQAEVRRSYGRALTAARRFSDAEAQLLRSLELLQGAYPRADHPNTTETRRALMALYQAWDKPDLVERHRVAPGQYVPY